MQNACGARELKILTQSFYMKLSQRKFFSMLGREIELCFNCYEEEKKKSNSNDIKFKENLDLRFDTIKMLKF